MQEEPILSFDVIWLRLWAEYASWHWVSRWECWWWFWDVHFRNTSEWLSAVLVSPRSFVANRAHSCAIARKCTEYSRCYCGVDSSLLYVQRRAIDKLKLQFIVLCSNWYPLFVIVTYILTPIPACAMKSDDMMGGPSVRKDVATFLTTALVLSGYGIPWVLWHHQVVLLLDRLVQYLIWSCTAETRDF